MSVAVGAPISARSALAGRGLRLEALTIAWNVAEAAIAPGAGIAAGSVALTGFGLDSVIEVVAAAALYARLRAELGGAARVDERRALRVVAASFFLLAAYVVVEAGFTLWQRHTPESSLPGLIIAVLAVVVMPLLARAKLRVGIELGSAALVADAKCSLACGWLSATVLLGLALNFALGWWWADPIAALCMVPFLVREGRETAQKARGEKTSCSCHGGCDAGDGAAR